MDLEALEKKIREIAGKLEFHRFMPKDKREQLMTELRVLVEEHNILEREMKRRFSALIDIFEKRGMTSEVLEELKMVFAEDETCKTCGGMGEIEKEIKDHEGKSKQVKFQCNSCKGKGFIDKEVKNGKVCPKCSGRGKVTESRVVKELPGAQQLKLYKKFQVDCDRCGGKGYVDMEGNPIAPAPRKERPEFEIIKDKYDLWKLDGQQRNMVKKGIFKFFLIDREANIIYSHGNSFIDLVIKIVSSPKTYNSIIINKDAEVLWKKDDTDNLYTYLTANKVHPFDKEAVRAHVAKWLGQRVAFKDL